ncbi:MAG: Ig-like domain-containing protein [Chloroflexota bacterium]
MRRTQYQIKRIVTLGVFVGLIVALLLPVGGGLVALNPQDVAASELAQSNNNNGFGPGDIYREFPHSRYRTDECGLDAVNRLHPDGDRPACDPNSRWRERHIPDFGDRPPIDTTNAIRSEMAVEFWGGHVGTSQQQVSVNPNSANFAPGPNYPEELPPNIDNVDWLNIQQPPVAAGEKSICYFRNVMGRSIVPIDLGDLRDDQRNTFRFRGGSQDSDCPNRFNWGLYYIYTFRVRVYYNENVAHPTGRIDSPTNGATVGESPIIEVDTTGSPVPVERVDLIAKYNDFDWDGNGVFREWQYRTEHYLDRRNPNDEDAQDGILLKRHVGSRTSAPYVFAWDTTWVPDQDQPVELMARIRGTNGVYYMTEAVSVNFERDGRSVRMFTVDPEDMPENFGVRQGRTTRDTQINVTRANPLDGAARGRLEMSTWAGTPDYNDSKEANSFTTINLNGTEVINITRQSSQRNRLGRVYNYGDVELNLREEAFETIEQGKNEFEIVSNRASHAFEIHLPGPALKIDYGDVVANSAVATTSKDTNVSIRLDGASTRGNNVTFRITDNPDHGRLIGAGNNRTYEPNAGFAGQDRFTFEVEDNVTNQKATADIVVIVNASDENNAPQVNAGNDITINEGATITQSGSFTDPDSSSWTVTADYGDGSNPTTLERNGNQFALDHTYIDDGEYTVTVSVDDGNGGVGTDTLSVTVNNVAPEISAVGEQSAKRGEPIELSLATFTDPGSDDTHSATIDWGDGSEPTPGVVNQEDGTVSGTHTYAANGTYTIDVTVEDDDGASSSASMQITIVDNPVIAREDSASTSTGQAVTINVLENDEGGEGTARTVEITTEPENGTAVVNEDNTITYTPNDGFTGTDTFSYTVADEIGTRASAAVTVTVDQVVIDTNTVYLPMIVR